MLFDKKIPQSFRKLYTLDTLSASFFAIFNAFVLSFVIVVMRKQGLDDLGIGFLAAAPSGASLFIFFLLNLSFMTDKFTYISLMKSLGRALLLIPILLHNKNLFVIIFFIYFIIEKGVTPTYTSIMKDIYPTRYRGRTMGLVKIEQTLVTMLLSLFAGKLFDLLPYSTIFTIGIGFGVLSQIFIYQMKGSVIKPKSNKHKHFHFKIFLKILSQDKLMIKYFSIFMLLGSSNLLISGLVPMYMVDILHLSNFLIGLTISLASFAMILGFYFGGHHIDTHDPLRTRIIVIFILAGVPLSYISLFFFKNITWLAFGIVCLASILQGFAISGGEIARINLFTRIINEHYLEQYWAFDFFLLGLRGITMPFIGIGLKNIFGFTPVFILSATLMLTAGLLMLKFYVNNFKKLKTRGLISLH